MKRRILIVDDEGINRNILAQFLEDEYDILMAENGKAALDILHKDEEIAAVLLDIVMPIMDGYEVIEHMKEEEKLSNIPILVQTIDGKVERKALTLGANDYVVKPYDPEILKMRLTNMIQLRENASIINATKRDSLTGLLNRNTFLDLVEEMVAQKEKGHYVLSCFDIDKFKVVNDLYGAKKGDEVLKTIGKRILLYFTEIDGICCRINADNFAVLYPVSYMDSKEIEEVRQKAVMIDGILSLLSFSVGRYVIEDKSLTATAMYDRAIMAKATIKGRYDIHVATYEESMRKRILSEQEIVSEMNAALRDGQFEVWYQPQFNHITGAIFGAEALIRWNHPEKGLVKPELFIPIFEQNGFVYEIDKFVIEQSCKYIRKMQDMGIQAVPISVNISRYDVYQQELVPYILKMLMKYKLSSNMLRIEITESAFSKSTDQIIVIMNRLKEEGFIIEIDDFGSGYSSLNTLKDVPADVIKLDMKFLEEGRNSDKGGSIIASVIRMAKWIGMTVIAEGIENIQQANFLKSVGCFYIQGFLYSQPIRQDDFKELLAKNEKEESLLAMEKLKTYDTETFWNPASMETLIFNSFVGGACVFEYYDNKGVMLRVNEKYVHIMRADRLTDYEVIGNHFMMYIVEEDKKHFQISLQKAIAAMEEVTDEIELENVFGSGLHIYVQVHMRVIAKSGYRYLVYCIVEDITEKHLSKRESEREIRQREEIINKQFQKIKELENELATVRENCSKRLTLS